MGRATAAQLLHCSAKCGGFHRAQGLDPLQVLLLRLHGVASLTPQDAGISGIVGNGYAVAERGVGPADPHGPKRARLLFLGCPGLLPCRQRAGGRVPGTPGPRVHLPFLGLGSGSDRRAG